MKKVTIVLIFCLIIPSLFALPPSMTTWKDGNMEMGVDYTLSFPDFGSNWGGQFNIYSPYHWGIGFSFVLGGSIIEATAGFLGFIDIPGNPYLVVPINIKVGFINEGLGVTLESGVKYFFGEIVGYGGINEAMYFTADLLAGLHICFMPVAGFFDTQNALEFNGWLIIPAGSANLGICFPLVDGGYIYI